MSFLLSCWFILRCPRNLKTKKEIFNFFLSDTNAFLKSFKQILFETFFLWCSYVIVGVELPLKDRKYNYEETCSCGRKTSSN